MLLQIASSVLIDSNRRAMSVSFREWLDRSGVIGSASGSIREMDDRVASLLAWLALPQFGPSTVFVVAVISATLLPLGSEPAVFGRVKLNPELFWPAIVVATAATLSAARWPGGWAMPPNAPCALYTAIGKLVGYITVAAAMTAQGGRSR